MKERDFGDFLELLRLSNHLKANSLPLNEIELRKLLPFLAIVETNLHIANKNRYIELLNNYLKQSATSEQFLIAFIDLYKKINYELNNLTSDIDRNQEILKNLLYENYNETIADLLMLTYGDSENFGLDSKSLYEDEIELKQHVKKLVDKLQKV